MIGREGLQLSQLSCSDSIHCHQTLNSFEAKDTSHIIARGKNSLKSWPSISGLSVDQNTTSPVCAHVGAGWSGGHLRSVVSKLS